MDTSDIYLTKDGHRKLVAELEFLKTQKRRKLSKAVEEARLHGDISENAEYDSAKEALALNEERIRDLESKLSHSRIIDDENIPKDKAFIGAKIKIKDLESGEELEYMLVSGLEADYASGKISIISPVGKALLGKALGDIIEIEVPAGILKYKILSISR